MARHVADLSLALGVLGDSSDGFLAGDVPPVPFSPPEEVDLRGLTIGVFDDDQVFPASTSLKRLVGEAADALRERGANVVPWPVPRLPAVLGIANYFDLYCALIGADGGNDVRRIVDGDKLDWRVSRLLALASLSVPTRALVTGGLSLFGQTWMSRLVDVARPRSADVYRRLSYAKSKFAKAVTQQLQDAGIDALLGPPHALPAMQHVKGFDLIAAASYSMLFNLLGFPAGTVSLSRVRAGEENGRPTTTRDQVERQALAVDRGSAGLPIGVQVAALPWREDIVLAVMGALEQSFDSRGSRNTGRRRPTADRRSAAVRPSAAARVRRGPAHRPDRRPRSSSGAGPSSDRTAPRAAVCRRPDRTAASTGDCCAGRPATPWSGRRLRRAA
jgi:fatty acid amide hydrolase